jgi:hypothetical protein
VAEILGVKMLWERKPANLTDKSSVIQFISTFFNQIKANLFENRPTKTIPNEVVCVSKVFASQDWMNWMKDENYRRELVLRGETFANVFMSYRRNFRESVAAAPHTAVLHTTPVIEPKTAPTPPTLLSPSDMELDSTAPAPPPAPAPPLEADYEIQNNDLTMM